MQKVLTSKEYKKLKRKKQEEIAEVKESSEEESAPVRKEKKPVNEYTFYHPENPVGTPLNKIIRIHVVKEGKEKIMPVSIMNGAVKTRDEDIYKRLITMGYEFLGVRAIT